MKRDRNTELNGAGESRKKSQRVGDYSKGATRHSERKQHSIPGKQAVATIGAVQMPAMTDVGSTGPVVMMADRLRAFDQGKQRMPAPLAESWARNRCSALETTRPISSMARSGEGRPSQQGRLQSRTRHRRS